VGEGRGPRRGRGVRGEGINRGGEGALPELENKPAQDRRRERADYPSPPEIAYSPRHAIPLGIAR